MLVGAVAALWATDALKPLAAFSTLTTMGPSPDGEKPGAAFRSG